MPSGPFDVADQPQADVRAVQDLTRPTVARKQVTPEILDTKANFLLGVAQQGVGLVAQGARIFDERVTQPRLAEEEKRRKGDIRKTIEDELTATQIAQRAAQGDQIALDRLNKAGTAIAKRAVEKFESLNKALLQGRTSENHANVEAQAFLGKMFNRHPEQREFIEEVALGFPRLSLLGSRLVPPAKSRKQTREEKDRAKIQSEANIRQVPFAQVVEEQNTKRINEAKSLASSTRKAQGIENTQGFLQGASLVTGELLNQTMKTSVLQQRTPAGVDTGLIANQFEVRMRTQLQKDLTSAAKSKLPINVNEVVGFYEGQIAAGVEMIQRGDFLKALNTKNDAALGLARSEHYADATYIGLAALHPDGPLKLLEITQRLTTRDGVFNRELARRINPEFAALEDLGRVGTETAKAIKQLFNGNPPTNQLEADLQAVAAKIILQTPDDPTDVKDTVDQEGNIVVPGEQKKKEKNEFRNRIHNNSVRQVGEPLTFDQYDNDGAATNLLGNKEHTASFRNTYTNQRAARMDNLVSTMVQLQGSGIEFRIANQVETESLQGGIPFPGQIPASATRNVATQPHIAVFVPPGASSLAASAANTAANEVNKLASITRRMNQVGVIPKEGSKDVIEFFMDQATEQVDAINKQQAEVRVQAENLESRNALVDQVLSDPSPENLAQLKLVDPEFAAAIDVEIGGGTILADTVPATIQSAFQEAIKDVPGTTESELAVIAQLESSLNPEAKNPNSSAKGLFQIINATRKELMQGVVTEGKTVAQVDSILAAKLIQRNKQALAKKGIAGDVSNLYKAHFLGIGDAIKVLNSEMDTPIDEVLSAKVINANPNVFVEGMTIGQFNNFINNRVQQAQGVVNAAS